MATRRTVLKLGAVGAATLAFGTGTVIPTNSDDELDGNVSKVFSAGFMTGNQEVPPVTSPGGGAAVFGLSPGGTQLGFAVFLADAANVTMAHIHRGSTGENGPIVVWLFGKRDETGALTSPLDQGVTCDGLLAHGVITDEDLVGPLAGMTLDDLLAEMESGNTYVNVHSEQNPGGEVRGQIDAVSAVEVEFEEDLDLRVVEGVFNAAREVRLDVVDDNVNTRGNAAGPGPDQPLSVTVECTGETGLVLIKNVSKSPVRVVDAPGATLSVAPETPVVLPGDSVAGFDVGDGVVSVQALDPESDDPLAPPVMEQVSCGSGGNGDGSDGGSASGGQ